VQSLDSREFQPFSYLLQTWFSHRGFLICCFFSNYVDCIITWKSTLACKISTTNEFLCLWQVLLLAVGCRVVPIDLVLQLCITQNKINWISIFQVWFVYCKLVPSVCNIHMMTLLVSQVFIGLSEQYSYSAVAYQMAPTCSNQMNLLPCTLPRYPINFVLGYCIAAAPDPARDYWCANCSTATGNKCMHTC